MGPVFDVGADIKDVAAGRLLSRCASSPLVAAMPLELGELAAVIRHTRTSSPGPDGLPYSVWTSAGDPGVRLFHRAYSALLNSVPPAFEFNRSLVLYIPK